MLFSMNADQPTTEESTMTAKQQEVVEGLEKKGWRFCSEDDDTVYLAKRGAHRGETLYCQVDADGTVN